MSSRLLPRPSKCHNAGKGMPKGKLLSYAESTVLAFGSGIKMSQKPTDKQQSGNREGVENMNFYFSTKYSHGVCRITVSIDSTFRLLPSSQIATRQQNLVGCFRFLLFVSHKNYLNLCTWLVIVPVSRAKSNMLSLFSLHLFSSLLAFLSFPRIL